MKHFFNKKVEYKKGQAVMIAIILFVVISVVISGGVMGPTVRGVQATNFLVKSKQGYALSEAGVEDVVYRVKQGLAVDSTETLTLNGETATTVKTEVANETTVLAEGDWQNFIRKIRTVLFVGQGASFNFGIQVGNGGIILEQNAGFNGNAYSNGNIDGENGSYINGTAAAANSFSLVADQVNDTPSTPVNSIVFGDAVGTQDTTQSFEVSETGPINKIDLYIKKTGSPSNVAVSINSDSGGLPSGAALASGVIDAAQVTTNYGWVSVTFDVNATLNAGVTYWVVLDASTGSASKKYTWAANSDTYANGQAKIGRYGTSWSDTTPSGLDGYFRIFIGGLISHINSVVVGTGAVGDAFAHSVTNSTVAGNLYCQTGSGNNKACDTSLPDPTPQALPLSEASIQAFKDDAAGGGVINGDYTVSEDESLGPKQINGDLVIANGEKLTLTGTVYVTGSISIGTGSVVELDSATYGPLGGVLMSDEWIHVDNNAITRGTGQAGSYFMLMSLSVCNGEYSTGCTGHNGAMELRNGSIHDAVYIPYGFTYLYQNVTIKALTAWKLQIENNAVVNYESGMRSSVFQTGPSGGWSIESWQEVE